MRFVIVTGMSGAGKSTALNRLEDMGYFCVDNLPISLISKFAEMAYTPGSEIQRVAPVSYTHLASDQGTDNLKESDPADSADGKSRGRTASPLCGGDTCKRKALFERKSQKNGRYALKMERRSRKKAAALSGDQKCRIDARMDSAFCAL